jgi:hypothetical protein
MIKTFAALAALAVAIPAVAAPSMNPSYRYVIHGDSPGVKHALFVDEASLQKLDGKRVKLSTVQVSVVDGKVAQTTYLTRTYECRRPFAQTNDFVAYNADRQVVAAGVDGNKLTLVKPKTLDEWSEAFACLAKRRKNTVLWPHVADPADFALKVASGAVKLKYNRGGIWWIGNVKML